MEITIPTSLKDIKLKELMAYELSDKSDDALIKHLCNVENPKLIPVKEYNELVLILREVLNQNVEFNKIFKHEGIYFGFIPKLDSMSGSEFIDIDEYTKNPKDWHKALSVLYRPLIKRKKNWFKRYSDDLYDIKAYTGSEQWCNEMLNVSCVYYLGALVFFYNLGNDLLSDTMDYSLQKLTQMNKLKASL